jgi:drug/metabolite transporter (DMT)-like permease
MRRGISGVDFACIAYLGIVQLGLAYLLFTSAMARGVRSIDASIIGYIEPVLNPVWVFLFIGERPSGWALVGGAIIIASVIVHMIIGTRSKATKRITADLTAHE